MLVTIRFVEFDETPILKEPFASVTAETEDPFNVTLAPMIGLLFSEEITVPLIWRVWAKTRLNGNVANSKKITHLIRLTHIFITQF